MLRFTLATALVSACFAFGAPGAAVADERLEGMCAFAGGTMDGDTCVLPDGRTVTCASDESECVVHDAPLTVRSLGKLINVPKLILKKPAQPGPVEIETSRTFKLEAPSETSVKRLDAPVMKMETITVAPTVKFKSLN